MRFGSITANNIVQAANSHIVVGNNVGSPAATTDGTLHYNTTDANLEARINGQWVPITDGVRPVFGNIPPQSGTSNILNSNLIPTITGGTQILSVNYTPLYTKSVMEFRLNFMADINQSGYLSCTVFRNSTLIGMSVTSIDQYAGVLTTSTNSPTTFALTIFDQPNTTSQITYSVRFGSSAGTWYVNQASGYTYGGGASYSGNYSIKEHF